VVGKLRWHMKDRDTGGYLAMRHACQRGWGCGHPRPGRSIVAMRRRAASTGYVLVTLMDRTVNRVAPSPTVATYAQRRAPHGRAMRDQAGRDRSARI